MWLKKEKEKKSQGCHWVSTALLFTNHYTEALTQSPECPWFPSSLIFVPPLPNPPPPRVCLSLQHSDVRTGWGERAGATNLISWTFSGAEEELGRPLPPPYSLHALTMQSACPVILGYSPRAPPPWRSPHLQEIGPSGPHIWVTASSDCKPQSPWPCPLHSPTSC